MEHPTENNPEQGNRSDATPALSPGRTLRHTRERLGLSVTDVANQIKFATRQIDALEADDFQQLQGATFLRGFVRSYAKILQLDAQPLLEQLPLDKSVQQQLTPASVKMPFPAMLPSRRQNLIWSGAAILLAVILVGFGLWHSSTPRSLSEMAQKQSKDARVEIPVPLPSEMKIVADLPPEASIASSVPVVPKLKAAAEIAPTTVPEKKIEKKVEKKIPDIQATSQIEPVKLESQPKTVTPKADTSAQISSLRLVFGEESWTEIKDKDDKIISSQVNQPGSELRLHGHPPFTMLIGHALSVHLYQDDEEVDIKPYINKYSEVAHLTLE